MFNIALSPLSQEGPVDIFVGVGSGKGGLELVIRVPLFETLS